jgi:hypothetical protein
MIIDVRQKIGIEVRSSYVVIIAFVSIVMSGCSQPGGRGLIEVKIKDHRDAIGDFKSVIVNVQTIRLSPKVGLKFWQLGWIALNPTVQRIELTQYAGGSSATIFQGSMESRSFEALDLKIGRVDGVLKKEGGQVPINNKLTPITLPWVLNSGEVIMIVLDLSVVDMSDHPPEAYELQLVGYEVYRNGKLIDKIPPG